MKNDAQYTLDLKLPTTADNQPVKTREEKAARKREYGKRWCEKNRERLLYLKRKYHHKHKERLSRQLKEKKAANPEYYKARQRAYRARTQSEKKEQRAKLSREWAAKNREKTRETKRQWRVNNLERAAYLAARRRVKKVQAQPKWVDEEAIDKIYKEARRLSTTSGVHYSVDHMVPLIHPEVCGLHVPWNLRIIPLMENVLKNNTFIEELAQPANI
jgi:hypothetical protein